jgi:hypothetical protein
MAPMKSSAKKRNKAKKRRQKHLQREYHVIQETQYFSSMFIYMIMALALHILTRVTGSCYDSHRVRKDIERDIFNQLGDYYIPRAYRMDKHTFYRLHSILQPYLEQHFFPKEGGNRDIRSNPYLIKTEIRLSIALRYFAGASPYDLIVTHGVSMTSIFFSIWGVVDCVNKCPYFDIVFPDYKTQEEIAKGFQKRSGANFSRVIGAIDGILIWILKPLLQECYFANCGETSFNCSRKDKYGLNMQAICDDELRFIFIDLSWPGATADYMAWVTSWLCLDIELCQDTELPRIKKGFTLVGDNAYVKTQYMSVPIKGTKTDNEDSYNFYQSQLRITIERSFGVLVHRWSILRGPLTIPLFKVVPLVQTLCKLHNFCINERLARNENLSLPALTRDDTNHLNRLVKSSTRLRSNTKKPKRQKKKKKKRNKRCKVVDLDSEGTPQDLLGGGEHFTDCPARPTQQELAGTNYAMDIMLRSVAEQELTRPTVN